MVREKSVIILISFLLLSLKAITPKPHQIPLAYKFNTIERLKSNFYIKDIDSISYDNIIQKSDSIKRKIKVFMSHDYSKYLKKLKYERLADDWAKRSSLAIDEKEKREYQELMNLNDTKAKQLDEELSRNGFKIESKENTN